MSQGVTCPLCLNTCAELKSPPKENLVWKQLYTVIAKYFLEIYVEPGCDLCMDCWHQNLNFLKFQLTVLEAHKKKNRLAAEQNTSGGSQGQATNSDALATEATEEQQQGMPTPDNELVQQMNPLASNTDEMNMYCQSSISDNNTTDGDDMTSDENVAPTNNTGAQQHPAPHPDVYKHFVDYQQIAETSKAAAQASFPRTLNQNSLVTNIMVKSDQYISCNHCVDSFPNITMLQRHFRRKHPREKFYILCCDKMLKRRWTIEEHIRLHGQKNTRACPKRQTK